MKTAHWYTECTCGRKMDVGRERCPMCKLEKLAACGIALANGISKLTDATVKYAEAAAKMDRILERIHKAQLRKIAS